MGREHTTSNEGRGKTIAVKRRDMKTAVGDWQSAGPASRSRSKEPWHKKGVKQSQGSSSKLVFKKTAGRKGVKKTSRCQQKKTRVKQAGKEGRKG